MSGEIIFHDPYEGRWTSVPRAIIQNSRLSVEARFLMVFLLAKPENWTVRPESLRSELQFSREKWGRVTSELIAAGHWERVTKRGEKGHFFTDTCVRACPISPGAGKPVPGEPAAGQPPAGDPAPLSNTEIRKKENNNNACALAQLQPSKFEDVVVVFDVDLQERNLLSNSEQQFIKAMLTSIPNSLRQTAADELSGALRARGRQGPRSIKNPVAFARSFFQVDPGSWTYSPGEKELREARSRPVHLSSPRPHSASEVKGPYGPPPSEIRAQIDQILGRKPAKTGV